MISEDGQEEYDMENAAIAGGAQTTHRESEVHFGGGGQIQEGQSLGERDGNHQAQDKSNGTPTKLRNLKGKGKKGKREKRRERKSEGEGDGEGKRWNIKTNTLQIWAL